jgi:hypothetical protein
VLLLVTLIALPLALVIAVATAAAICVLILAIPWSAVLLVAPGNWLPKTDAPFPPVWALDECLVRICLMYLGIAMSASLREPESSLRVRVTASHRQVLILLPVSDAAIRRHESPWRAWPGLFAYGLLVFASLEWYHGPRVALSAFSVPFFALSQAWLTLAAAGIGKILWRQGQWGQVMVAFTGCMTIFVSIFAPANLSTQLWIRDSLLVCLPTGWLLTAWHGGWLQGRAMPWLWFVLAAVVWRTERWLVHHRPINVASMMDGPMVRGRRIAADAPTAVFNNNARSDLHVAVAREIRMATRWCSTTGWQSRWRNWPMTARDRVVLASLDPTLAKQPASTVWVLMASAMSALWMLYVFLILHQHEESFPLGLYSLVPVVLMLSVVIFRRMGDLGMEPSLPFGLLPIGYDETLLAFFRLSIAFAKRFLPGVVILVLTLIACDHPSPLKGAAGCGLPFLLWVGLSPVVCSMVLHFRYAAPLGALVGLLSVIFAGMLSISCLMHIDQPGGTFGFVVGIGAVLIVTFVLRRIHLAGFGEGLFV